MMQPGPSVPPQIHLTHSILSGGTFNQHNYIHSGQRPGYARLLENVAPAALHDSVDNVDPPKCYPNTRVAIIETIRDWTLGTDEELSKKPILWLKGAAGAGKSAIARSVAERCSNEGLLLGTFFFSAGDTSRNHVKSLVATLSSQISVVLPEFRGTVAAFIEDDPLIFGRSIRTQFSTLVVRPLSIVLANRPAASTATPCLIIIDGLDECSAVNSQRDLLLTLQEITNTTSLIRFLVGSRPESHLNSAFNLPRIVPVLYKIFLDDDYSARVDIRVYLEDKFKLIKEGHPFRDMLPDPWPPHEQVYPLVNKSSGQFIYAATVVRYVESSRHRPDQRLNAIFNLRPPFKDLPFTELDALYRLIISKAEDLPAVLDILTFPALYGDFLRRDIEEILHLEQGSVRIMLADLHSIITFSHYESVEFLHKSLEDFLSDPQRAGDLHRDLSRARLFHVARLINIFSTPSYLPYCPNFQLSILEPIDRVVEELEEPDNMKADYISSEILQAARQFSTFDFFTAHLIYGHREEQDSSWWESIDSDWDFIFNYFDYLHHIKDVCESTRLVYWEQMQQYCESVLAVLYNNLSDSGIAHFVFGYCHLLHGPHSRLPRKLPYLNLNFNLSYVEVGTFGKTIIKFMTQLQRYAQQTDDIIKIFNDLTGSMKKEVIFAKSASFCLSVLCDESNANEDADRIYGTARHDRRKKREHPWHWRQIVPRPPSLGNRVALITFRTIYVRVRGPLLCMAVTRPYDFQKPTCEKKLN
ncbi:hypothetical protein D9613_003563 [Agrocybe pediades]|uniref:Nephrocystin 3-like N-terminal domain-containing protein n=1 Tax=Agrocybe pediades TaxID=84607 RepID=A0A8H4VLG3_9AGAR|nr:hypothetical protein D9613_003563 [Agrocybe pediades]